MHADVERLPEFRVCALDRLTGESLGTRTQTKIENDSRKCSSSHRRAAEKEEEEKEEEEEKILCRLRVSNNPLPESRGLPTAYHAPRPSTEAPPRA